jgi:hypothetical protein
MTRSKRRILFVVLPLLTVLPFAACGDDKTTIIQGGSGELTEVQTSPAVLSFEHVIGRSQCPQIAGEFRVANTTTSLKALTFRVSTAVANVIPPIRVPTGTDLAGGAAQNIPVVFDCSVRTPFEATISVEVAGRAQGTVAVRGDVHN